VKDPAAGDAVQLTQSLRQQLHHYSVRHCSATTVNINVTLSQLCDPRVGAHLR